MGSLSSKEKKVIRTVVLSPPVATPTQETIVTKSAIQVVSGDSVATQGSPLYVKQLNTWAWENATHHHTKKFDLPRRGTLVVRRGQPFKLTLTFNRPYNSLTDELKFFFETGESPKPSNDTMVCLSSYTSQGSSGWKSDFLPVTGTRIPDGLKVDLWIFTPADCVVSDWKFSLQSIYRAEMDMATVTYEHPEKIYILFNPWNKKDTVYHPAERMLDEYIMNPSGLIFQGTNKQKTVKPWIYGQFESGILEACIYIMKSAFKFKTSQSMGDPVKVSRNICSVINATDNNGVIEGLWSSNIGTGGRSPTMWSGSVSILKQYINNAQETKGDKPQPVKHGHCYVFAGLMTTICRAIGIPCRCVTSYNYAATTKCSTVTEINYSMDGSLEDVLHDTGCPLVWNFHVWNDVWMRQPDLKSPLNEANWHLIDPSTQKESCNGSQCFGPAHHVAIKCRRTDVEYDVDVLYAQINTEIYHWLKMDTGDCVAIETGNKRACESLSTKTPDGRPYRLTHKYTATLTEVEMSRLRQEVTSEYKRRDAMQPENRHREYRQKRSLHQCSAQDIRVRFSVKDYIYAGETFYVTVHLENKSTDTRTVHTLLYCESIHYNGQRENLLKKKVITKTLEPDSEDGVQIKLKESTYVDKLAEMNLLRQFAYVQVEETGQTEAMFEDFILQKPHLELEPGDQKTEGANFELKVKFKNPLQRSLTRCSVSVEGTGIESMLYIRNFEDIPAECEWTGIVNMLPVRSKALHLSVTFYCKELFDLTGSCVVQIGRSTTTERDGVNGVTDVSCEIEIPGIDI